MAVLLQRRVDPAVLRGRPGQQHADAVRHRRLLAVLGGPPVGGGLPGAVHHDDGRLHLRAPGGGVGAGGDPADLLRRHPVLDGRRGRDDAPRLLQRLAGDPHGARGVLLGRRGDPADAPDRRGLDLPAARGPAAGRRAGEPVPAPLGGALPGLGRLLELPRGGRLRLPDQPAGGELLPDRHVPDLEPRPRGHDGRLRDAGPGPDGLLPPLPDAAGGLERPARRLLVLDGEHRAHADGLRQPLPGGAPATGRRGDQRLLARPLGVRRAAYLPGMDAAAGRRDLRLGHVPAALDGGAGPPSGRGPPRRLGTRRGPAVEAPLFTEVLPGGEPSSGRGEAGA